MLALRIAVGYVKVCKKKFLLLNFCIKMFKEEFRLVKGIGLWFVSNDFHLVGTT